MGKKVDFKSSKGAIKAVARASDEKPDVKPDVKSEAVAVEPEKKEDFNVKTSFVFSNEQVLKVKSVAFWEQRPIKTIMYEALGTWIKKYERANGKIITPESKKK